MMVDLGAHYDEGFLQMGAIAEDLGISPKYLRALLIMLKAAGLIRSHSGREGGYALARTPSEIKVSEVMHVLEGFPAPVNCVQDGKVCKRSDYCAARSVWCDISKAIEDVMAATTLQDLVNRENTNLAGRLTFSI
jgi:Rrf2 family cysteine metabolism transcriptional repressor